MNKPLALVVFTDQQQVAWLRWLKPGFRHCFVVVRDPADEWIACDWLMGRLVLHAYGPQQPSELLRLFVDRGHRVVLVSKQPRPRARAWLRLFTCVELVKQTLGWANIRPLTPWGLYLALRAAGHPAYQK